MKPYRARYGYFPSLFTETKYWIWSKTNTPMQRFGSWPNLFEWDMAAHEKYPFLYWLTEELGPTLAHYFFMPFDAFEDITIYIRWRFIERSHVINHGIKSGGWIDRQELVTAAVWAIFRDWIESERARNYYDSLCYRGKTEVLEKYPNVKKRWFRKFNSVELGRASLRSEYKSIEGDDRVQNWQLIAVKEAIDLSDWYYDIYLPWQAKRNEAYEKSAAEHQEILRQSSHFERAVETAKSIEKVEAEAAEVDDVAKLLEKYKIPPSPADDLLEMTCRVVKLSKSIPLL